MKYQMSMRDYELISAYLDNQLSEKERTFLEARLKADPELKNELHEIEKTRLLVKSLPKLRAPHNYYIKAETVPIRPTLRLAPVFGIVSAVASVLLALVIFGSTFLASPQPVAMSPVVPVVLETQVIQPEAQSNAALPGATAESTTEAPPLMMAVPKEQASSTPFIGPPEPTQAETATPTTIYLFAYLPTATPENMVTLNQEQVDANRLQCEEYYGGSAYPTLTTSFDCPTPTSTLTPTPSSSPTPTSTPTSPLLVQELQTSASPTPSETTTPTETPTATPTPTSSPTASPSPTPSPTEMPLGILKAAPTSEAASPAGLTAPNVANDTGLATPSSQERAAGSGSGPNVSFANYLLLAIEISLAVIAVIAGIAAIIFRVQAGR